MRRKEFNFVYVDKMGVYTHGSSLRTTIPADIVKLFNLTSGEEVIFFKEENFKIALMMKAKRAKIKTDFGDMSFTFSISKELAEKLLADTEEK